MQTKMKRGRPPETDRHEISLVALRLFERKGFEGVTMDEVAKTAQVSRRTLFRLFPSKAALVWEGLDNVLSAVKKHVASLGRAKVPLRVLVREFFVPMLRQLDDPVMAKLARRRLRLIAASPELLSYPLLEELRQVVSSIIAAGTGSRRVPPTLVADALVATAFSSVRWWARQETPMSAGEALRTALAALAEATEGRHRRGGRPRQRVGERLLHPVARVGGDGGEPVAQGSQRLAASSPTRPPEAGTA